MLCDTDHRLGKAYGAEAAGSAYARRIAFLIDEAGTITKVYDPVSTKTHATDVLVDLTAS